MNSHIFDPTLDLILERTTDVPKELVWRAWTEPEQLMQWFCPLPWKTVECVIDLQPGGIFRTVMQGPEGQEFSGNGCYLEVVPSERIVWTSALGPGYRPHPHHDEDHVGPFTAMITFADHEGGTKYTATVIHGSESGRKAHAEMGFEGGWGTAFDQLVAMIKANQLTKRQKPGSSGSSGS